ncbi:MAG: bacterial transcriptional activator domain-containing protein [Actinomycetota bacterium]
MKKIAVVSSWMFLALVIPTALVLTGFTPRSSFVGVNSNLFDGSSETFAVHLGGVLLWLVWSYALFAFIYDLWQFRSRKAERKTSFGLRRWTTICASAVGSLLLASQTPVSAENSGSVDVTLGNPKEVNTEIKRIKFLSPTPLALTASTVVVSGILQHVRRRREKMLRESAPHSQFQSLSHQSRSTLTELHLAATSTNCGGIRVAMNSLMAGKPVPVLGSWRPDSTPRVVLERNEARMGIVPLCCVPLGLAQGEIILLTLACGDVISVKLDDDDRARSVLAHLAHSIVLETIGSDTRVITCGFTDSELIDAPHLSIVNSIGHLTERASNLEKSRSTIVCSVVPLSSEIIDELQAMGCCVVTAGTDLVADVALVLTENGWIVHPTQQPISLYGMTLDESKAVSKLVNEIARPATVPVFVDHFTPSHCWKVVVRMLGPVEVMSRDGRLVRFEKSKSIELLAWLTTHRSRPSRNAARTALWEVNVQDATFTNVVSDVRRSLGKVVQLDKDEEWLGRTLTDLLPLHLSVTTDGELLEATIQRALTLDGDAALAELRTALEYVRDLPFSGTNYLWPDAEGITTQLTLSVMTSAVMVSELYLERGDTEGVFWATGRGLKVLPGHEELLALRMRAHALKGDLAAVRAEWTSHQRSLARDVWSGGATSPKLDELCRALLQTPRQNVYSVSE